MSYILDALRRAEAERERGSVPSVHTQHVPSLPGDDDELVRERPVWLIGAVIALTLALGGVLAWNLFGSGPAPKPTPTPIPVATTPAPMPGAAPASAVTAPVAPAAPAATLPAAPTAPAVAGPAAPTPPATVAAPAGPARNVAAPSTRTAPPPTRRPAAAAAPSGSDDDATATATAKEDRVYKESEAPDAVRRALPKLSFGGSSWSTSASSRMVIWNGRVFHEGDTIAPGVVLRTINRKSAVLATKGVRVEVPF